MKKTRTYKGYWSAVLTNIITCITLILHFYKLSAWLFVIGLIISASLCEVDEL